MGEFQAKLNKLVIYGDSISTLGYGGGGYQQRIQEGLGIQLVENHAVSGSSLSAVMENCGLNILNTHTPAEDADLILVWYATNDWYWGGRVGNVTDKVPYTFLGAMNLFVDTIRQQCPKTPIVWLTPLYRFQAPYLSTTPEQAYCCPNASGATLFDFYNAVQLGCSYHGIQVIDMHKECNFHTHNAHLFLEDNVHPSKEGYKRIAEVLCRRLKQIY